MNFLELAKARYSCRKLSGDPIPQEQLDRILEAARSAPTDCFMIGQTGISCL